jgi:hypothetical protein
MMRAGAESRFRPACKFPQRRRLIGALAKTNVSDQSRAL